LNLKLLCTDRRPVREMLDIWPALPIVIRGDSDLPLQAKGSDNIIAALRHSDRVCQINLSDILCKLLGRIQAAIQEPFPVLTDLAIWSFGNSGLCSLIPFWVDVLRVFYLSSCLPSHFRRHHGNYF
jgi:hypothetical protein